MSAGTKAMLAAKAARRAAVLAVPAVCCVGHDCDGCRTCRLGRCCKRDLPNYHMPDLGSWDGPVWGTLGVLVDDGEHVQCHACGDWFMALPVHVWAAHGIWAAEYKAYFGLNISQGLTSGATHALMVASGLRLVAEGKLMPPTGWRDNYTTEQRHEMAGRKPRLQRQLAEPDRSAKISAALRGTHPSPAARVKMSAAQRRKGPISDETRARLSASAKKMWQTRKATP